MGQVWDDRSGEWVDESAPWVPVESQPVTAPDERGDPMGFEPGELVGGLGFYPSGEADEAFKARTRVGEDRSQDSGQARMRQAMSAARAALTAYEDAPDAQLRALRAAALALTVGQLLDEMGVRS